MVESWKGGSRRLARSSLVALLALSTLSVLVLPDPASGAVPCSKGRSSGAGRCHGSGGSANDSLRSPGGGGGGGDASGGGGGSGGDGGSGGGGDSSGPSPEEIARQQQQQLLAEADTYLLFPTVATDPDVERPSVIGVPTFFAVTNWQGQQIDTYRRGPWWVRITATPSLSLDPGEPGSSVIACEDGGTRFDPHGPSPDEQASRPGACAYTYSRRTGVPGRPEAWEATVIVSWTLQWEANFPLPGTLPASDVLTGTIERPVEEINTVVNRRS